MRTRVTRPRNILLLSIDGLRPDSLSCTEPLERTQPGMLRHTPAIDHLADSGIYFSQAYTTSPRSMEAHAALFTSALPGRHGVTEGPGEVSAVRRPTLARLLRRGGYYTAHCGSPDSRFVSAGLEQGFDAYGLSVEGLAPLLEARPEGVFLFVRWNELQRPGLTRAQLTNGQGGVARLWPQLGLPAAERGLKTWLLEGTAVSGRGPARWGAEDHQALRLAAEGLGSGAELRRLYQHEVNRLDEEKLIPLLELLQRHRFLENALLVLTSCAPESWSPRSGSWGTRRLCDESLRVPLLMAWPGMLREGGQLDAVLSHLDVLPTVLGLSGVSRRGLEVEGADLSGCLLGQKGLPEARVAYSEVWGVAPGEDDRPQRRLAQRSLRGQRMRLTLQGEDLPEDLAVLALAERGLTTEGVVQAVNRRLVNLPDTRALETWLTMNPDPLANDQDGLLSRLVNLSRRALGAERYQILQRARLERELSRLLTALNPHELPRGLRQAYEAWLQLVPERSVLERLELRVEGLDPLLPGVLEALSHLSPPRARYLLHRVEDEGPNLFEGELSALEEQEAIAMEVTLLSAFYTGRARPVVRQPLSRAPWSRQPMPRLLPLGKMAGS